MARSGGTNLDIVKQVAAAHSAQTVAPDESPPEAPAFKQDGGPVFFYNSRYPNERIYDPGDAQGRKGHQAGDVARSLDFRGAQFIAREQWQIDLLRKIPHVREADLEEPIPCEQCKYMTRSLRDYQDHIRKHM